MPSPAKNVASTIGHEHHGRPFFLLRKCWYHHAKNVGISFSFDIKCVVHAKTISGRYDRYVTNTIIVYYKDSDKSIVRAGRRNPFFGNVYELSQELYLFWI